MFEYMFDICSKHPPTDTVKRAKATKRPTALRGGGRKSCPHVRCHTRQPVRGVSNRTLANASVGEQTNSRIEGEMFKRAAAVYLPQVKVRVYHEVLPDSLDNALSEGVKRSTHGEKSDSLAKKTDAYLDRRRPEHLPSDLSRSNAVYGYLSDDDQLIDIKDGTPVGVKEFAAQRSQVLLMMTVELEKCFVSDLDRYDAVMEALEKGDDDDAVDQLAAQYWDQLTPLEKYDPGPIRRPEALITYDVAPSDITVV
jgi:hypothetical protein